jgi:phenylacetate-CoA ligase
MVLPGGETITDQARDRLVAAFGPRIRSIYASTECFFLSNGCDQHWYHVNADWAVLEPVDTDHRPVPPGEPSHTVLISNLANRVQPFLRYDLGDSVVLRPDPCPCGNPLPAVQVQGRAGDLLAFPAGAGATSELSPMLFGTLLDRTPGLDRYQVIQTAPERLRIRLEPHEDAEPDRVWQAVRDELDRMLAEHGVTGVALERAAEPPERTAGGKIRRIVPLA